MRYVRALTLVALVATAGAAPAAHAQGPIKIGLLAPLTGAASAVSQFWKYDPEEFLKLPLYTRDYPPCKHC